MGRTVTVLIFFSQAEGLLLEIDKHLLIVEVHACMTPGIQTSVLSIQVIVYVDGLEIHIPAQVIVFDLSIHH